MNNGISFGQKFIQLSIYCKGNSLKKLSSYKAVFFDVGGVLLKPHPSVGHIYAQYAQPYGFKGKAEDLDIEFRRQWDAMGGIESLGSQTGQSVERQFWRQLVKNVFDPHGGLENFDRYFATVFDAFKKKECWSIFDDVTKSNILPDLKDAGVTLGVISNWDSRLPATLKNMGLAQYFDFILPSATIGSAKPDGKIFQEALRLAEVEAEDACHIGDEIRTDVQGARDAGIDSILIDRKDKFEEGYDRKVKSFLELAI